MKLKEFNAENTKQVRSGVPAIGVNQKTGLFNINRLACETMKLGDGDSIIIMQDEDEPDNFYIEKVKANGFELRAKENVTAGLMFNNTSLARKIAAPGEIDGSYRLLIAGEPTKFEKRTLWGLLFRAAV